MHLGGRYTPFMDNYRPQLFLRTADITAGLHWPEGTPDAAEKMVRDCQSFLSCALVLTWFLGYAWRQC
jgi:translation elongation factor EF-Tu-like GTPase